MNGSLRGAVFCALAAAVQLMTPTASQTPAPFVTIDVAVTKKGATVDGLTREEFEVLVDGKPTPIASFSPPPAPITVVLLLDVTASMTNYGELGDDLDRAFAKVLESGDRARVGGIANRLQLSPEFTGDRRALLTAGRRAIDFRKEDRFGPSPIWDAADAAIAALEPERGRRAVILVSDGRSTGNSKGSVAVLNRALAAGVIVEVLSESRTLIIRQGETSAARVRTGLMLEEMARLTGGLHLPEQAPESGEFPEGGPLLSRLVRDLRAMYSVAIPAAGPPGSVHTLSVRVKRPDVVVRTRSGYRTASESR